MFCRLISHQFYRAGAWSLLPGERAALEGVLAILKPRVSIEIGTYAGETLGPISRHSEIVHSFDLVRRPEVTSERFSNVEFHIGDSHELLPDLLQRLSAEQVNVDFVFVDGDHTAEGVRRDVEDLLVSESVGRSVLLLHDTLLESVRTGLEEIDHDRFDKVRFVDLDFVAGQVVLARDGTDEFGRGLGIVVIGWDLEAADWPPRYRATDIWATFADALSRGEEPTTGTRGRAAYATHLELQELVAAQRSELNALRSSWSWRVTKPLRVVQHLLPRLH